MPKKPIDYSKAVIYKICCRDPTIKDIYIGSTTDLRKRKNNHKSTCNNANKKAYGCYVYEFIRNNNGWENWDVVVVEECQNIKNNEQLHTRERHYIEQLGAS